MFNECWENYKKQVLPKDASTIQIEQTKLAFYTGGSVVIEAFEAASDLPEDKSLELMETVKSQIDKYTMKKYLDALRAAGEKSWKKIKRRK